MTTYPRCSTLAAIMAHCRLDNEGMAILLCDYHGIIEATYDGISDPVDELYIHQLQQGLACAPPVVRDAIAKILSKPEPDVFPEYVSHATTTT